MFEKIKKALGSGKGVSRRLCETKVLLLTAAVIGIFCGAAELKAEEFKYVASNKQAKIYFFIDYHRNMQQSLSAKPNYIYQRVFKALQKHNGSFKKFMANEVYFFAPGKSLAAREIDSSEVPVFKINPETKGTWAKVYSSMKNDLPSNAVICIVSTNRAFESDFIQKSDFEKNIYFVTVNPRGKDPRKKNWKEYSVQDWEKEISEKLTGYKINELISAYNKLNSDELTKLKGIKISCTAEIGGIKLEMPTDLLRKDMWHWEIKHNDKAIEKTGTVAVVEGGNKISVTFVSPLGDRYEKQWNFSYRKLSQVEKDAVSTLENLAKKLKSDIPEEISSKKDKLDLFWTNDATNNFMELVGNYTVKLNDNQKIIDIVDPLPAKIRAAIQKEFEAAKTRTGNDEFKKTIVDLQEAVKKQAKISLDNCKGNLNQDLTTLFKKDFEELANQIQKADFKGFYKRLEGINEEIGTANANFKEAISFIVLDEYDVYCSSGSAIFSANVIELNNPPLWYKMPHFFITSF